MPLKWFRSHRRRSTGNTEDEATRPSTETPNTKQKTKQRSRRSHSHGHGLRSMIGLSGSMQHELDAAAAIAAEEQRRISYQTKTRRRFTIHGLSYQPKHNEEAGWSCNSTPAGSPQPMHASTSPRHVHSRVSHFGFTSTRISHTRSPQKEQMIPLTPDSHPSIIFIDCPP
ncbi:hypothetical protein F441_08302 [Phytophthora nicotianae CJ01A1]|uniref:Uncharacterized protein n=2 Tax=Phytophthora nicotianae TaxID=4792 RepID=W2IUA0_PHYNI|nr:hypothetical protein L915_10770 [Phytophthora nicotianae]ETL37696.1 hypothetical protein L916_10660 [Phytophthora nicotianae]ETP17293.1 hypothetical protein F441_08302 [Phytophthora nicotianae CJ01A1]